LDVFRERYGIAKEEAEKKRADEFVKSLMDEPPQK